MLTKFQNELRNKLRTLTTMSNEVALFITAQAVLETGNFTSNLYTEQHNLFGMKEPTQRITTALKVGDMFAHYTNNINSVIDYLLWVSYMGFQQKHLTDLDKFMLRLANSNYCPEQNYIKKIKQIYKQLKENDNEN